MPQAARCYRRRSYRRAPTRQLAFRDRIDDGGDLVRRQRRCEARLIPSEDQLQHKHGIDEAAEEMASEASGCGVALAFNHTIANESTPMIGGSRDRLIRLLQSRDEPFRHLSEVLAGRPFIMATANMIAGRREDVSAVPSGI